MTVNLDVTNEREPTAIAYSAIPLYQCPTTVTTAKITKVTCTNITSTPDTITVAIVKSPGTPGTSEASTNEYIPAKTIAGNTPKVLHELIGEVLEPGDFVNEISGVASSMIIKIAVKETSP